MIVASNSFVTATSLLSCNWMILWVDIMEKKEIFCENKRMERIESNYNYIDIVVERGIHWKVTNNNKYDDFGLIKIYHAVALMFSYNNILFFRLSQNSYLYWQWLNEKLNDHTKWMKSNHNWIPTAVYPHTTNCRCATPNEIMHWF